MTKTNISQVQGKPRIIWHEPATLSEHEWKQILEAFEQHQTANRGWGYLSKVQKLRESNNTPLTREQLGGGLIMGNEVFQRAKLPFRVQVIGERFPSDSRAKFAIVPDIGPGVIRKKSIPLEVLNAVVERVRLRTDPEHDVFEVTLEQKSGIWKHLAVSEPQLMLFLEGVKAGVVMMGGQFKSPDIPSTPTKTFDETL